MAGEDLKKRTKVFALRVLSLVEHLPRSIKARVIEDQIVKCGTSVAANYRAVCRGRTRAEFIAKLGVVIEEADECAFWLEIIMEDGLLPSERVKPLWEEANELVAIMTSSRKTAEHSQTGLHRKR